MSLLGVTAHGGPCGPLQFDRLGSRPWPPLIASLGTSGELLRHRDRVRCFLLRGKNYGKAQGVIDDHLG